MGTRRKLSVSVNNCGICSGVLKVGDQIYVSCMLSMQQPALYQALHYTYLWIISFTGQDFGHAYRNYHTLISA